jgi:hypothetical protein
VNSLVVISWHTPWKCVIVLVGTTCTSSAECKIVITAVLTVMCGMDPHMIRWNLSALSSLVLGLPVSCPFLVATRPSSVSIFTPRELEVRLVFFLQTTPQGLSLGLVMVFPLYLHKIHLSCCQYFKVFLMRAVE